jgi:hypothetical protein
VIERGKIMIKENEDRKRIRDFLLQGNNDIYGYTKKMKLDPKGFKEKVAHALLNGPDKKINRYNRYLEAALASFMSNEENVALIALTITDHQPTHERNWPLNDRENKICEEFHKNINRENLKIDVFFQQLPTVLLKNDEYINSIAQYLKKTNSEVKNLIVDNEINRGIVPLIEETRLSPSYSLVRGMEWLSLEDTIQSLNQGLNKYLSDKSPTNDSIYVNRLSGDFIAYVVGHSKDTIHKMMALYPQANHFLIELFKEHKENPKLDELKRGTFVVRGSR